jgi:hypothetical protein
MPINTQHQPPQEHLERIARAGLGSLLTIAMTGGAASDRSLAVVRGVRDHILHVELDLDTLTAVSPADLAAAVHEPEWRERILTGMTILALLDGKPTPERLEVLATAASALGLATSPANTYRQLLEEKFLRIRLDVARRSFIPEAIKGYVGSRGLSGATELVETLLGVQDKALAERYRTLDDYPERTFGRALADFVARNRFSYPGEMGGPPAPLMRHDCCHVLGDYGTTAAEECAVLSFQAGFEKADPFFVILFGLAQFELGVSVSPFVPATSNQADPISMLAALEHGTQVNRDLIGDPAWDPWDHFSEPIDAVRAQLNILPRGHEPQYIEFND